MSGPLKGEIDSFVQNEEAAAHGFHLHTLTVVQAVFGVCALLWLVWKMRRTAPRTKWLPEDHPEAVRAAAQGRILARRENLEPAPAKAPTTQVVDRKSRASVELLDDGDADADVDGGESSAPPPLPPRPNRSKKD